MRKLALSHDVLRDDPNHQPRGSRALRLLSVQSGDMFSCALDRPRHQLGRCRCLDALFWYKRHKLIAGFSDLCVLLFSSLPLVVNSLQHDFDGAVHFVHVG